MDVLGLKTGGIENVVAPLGTALTSGHVRLIARTTRNIVLVFDGDEAGTRAALRSLPIFIELGIMPRAAMLPVGEDPDSYIRAHGADEFRHIVAHAQPLFDHFIDHTVADTGSDNVGKVAAMQRIAPLLKQMTDPVEQTVYCRRLADRLGMEEATVRKAVGSTAQNMSRIVARATSKDKRVIVPTAERTLVELMMQVPDSIPRVLNEIAADDVVDEFAQAMIRLIGQHYEQTGNTNVSEMLGEIADPEAQQELREMAVASATIVPEEAEQVLADCIQAIRERSQKQSQRELNELIRQAEEKGDEKQLYDLLRRKHDMITSDDKRC
jgi:DNA primase